MVDQFVFGYGSLILSSSRDQTIGEPSSAVPVRVIGVQREWSLAAPELGLTAVSLREAERDGVCNGVVFPVHDEQLKKLDERETGYKRIKLDNGAITSLKPEEPIPLSATVWAYVANKQGMPTPICPIAQTYLDVILTGCINEFGQDFAREFIVTTTGWSEFWVNDRAHPRYPRSLKEVPYAQTIDRMLSEMVFGSLYYQRYPRMRGIKYKIDLQQCAGGVSVSCPGLPGCQSQGKDEGEAIKNIQAAIREYLGALAEMLKDTNNWEIEVPI